MKPAPFTYHAPTSIDEAVGLLAEHGDDAKVIAGGQSLVPIMALRLARFGHLVDLGSVPSLRGIRRDGDALVVGAMTTHRTLETDDMAAAASPLISRVAPYIGHFQIRNRGTIGGSCAHADPAAEWPVALTTLGAEFVVFGAAGERTVPAGAFFVSTFMTVLEADEILTAVRIPVWPRRSGFGVAEFSRRHGDFAVAGATVGISLDAAGKVQQLAIGLLGLGPVPLRAAQAESLAIGQFADSIDLNEVGRLAMDDSRPADDVHGDANYRRRLGARAVESALQTALKEATSV